jgi:hypothetical protein
MRYVLLFIIYLICVTYYYNKKYENKEMFIVSFGFILYSHILLTIVLSSIIFIIHIFIKYW